MVAREPSSPEAYFRRPGLARIPPLNTRPPSPDLHSPIGGQERAVPLLHAKGGIELGHVAHHAIHPVLARRVRMREELLAQCVLAIERAPHLAPAEEEALVTREALDDRRFLAPERQLVGLEGHGQATQVADVLTQGELAIDVHALDRAEARVLVGQEPGALLEGGLVLRAPPVPQVAIAIGAAALIVEAVADFMPDDAADGTAVGGVVRVGGGERGP